MDKVEKKEDKVRFTFTTNELEFVLKAMEHYTVEIQASVIESMGDRKPAITCYNLLKKLSKRLA